MCTHNKIITSAYYPSTVFLQEVARQDQAKYIILSRGTTPLQLAPYAIERLIQAAEMSGAVMVYSDYYLIKNKERIAVPTTDYQQGSLRDDFDFGQLVLYRSSSFCEAVGQMRIDYQYAALYDLRLKLSRLGQIVHLPEYLYTVDETDFRTSGEKQFDYVNPRNREVQIEMEKACTSHLKSIGAWLPPSFNPIPATTEQFPVEASVIIPVRNREKTIADAVNSALEQKTDFTFNVIVIDNHSTDATTTILKNLAQQNPALIHCIPSSGELGIGGCWTLATMHPQCGKFAVQLDSDDLYNGKNVLQTIIDTFHSEQCAMVVGSYQMVNFKLEEIPPGIVDHREWTPDNGRNNALRINGLGAPRAFYTPLLRQIKFPNVSYGEDYAVALAISRDYQIGRIYTPLYLCRRWEENTDANLSPAKLNIYNSYKDKIRTLEIQARIQKNSNQHPQ